MRKAFKAAVAAVSLGAAALVTAVPAQAQPYHRYDRRHDDNDVAGAAIAAGIVGLALGAALSSSNRNDRYYTGSDYDGGRYQDYRYSQPYRGYAQPYAYGYAQPYGYSSSYRTCTARRSVYDPYIGRRVVVRERYAC